MRISIGGVSYELQYQENAVLVAELAARLTQQPSQPSSPAGDRSPQATDLIVHVRTAAA